MCLAFWRRDVLSLPMSLYSFYSGCSIDGLVYYITMCGGFSFLRPQEASFLAVAWRLTDRRLRRPQAGALFAPLFIGVYQHFYRIAKSVTAKALASGRNLIFQDFSLLPRTSQAPSYALVRPLFLFAGAARAEARTLRRESNYFCKSFI